MTNHVPEEMLKHKSGCFMTVAVLGNEWLTSFKEANNIVGLPMETIDSQIAQ